MSSEANGTDGDGEQLSSRIVGAKSLGRNTGLLFAAELALAVGRTVTFVLLADALGAEELGRYAGVLGLAQLVLPITRFGIAHLMVRAISRGEAFPPQWAKASTMALVAGPLGSLFVVGLSSILVDVSALAVFLIAISQLVSLGLQQAAGMAAAAQGRSEIGLAVTAASTIFRVSAVLIFFFAVEPLVDNWAPLLAVAAAASSISTILIVQKFLGGRLKLAIPSAFDMRLGSGFVFVDLANTAQADIDKVVLNGFDLPQDAGVYAAANRVTDLAGLPLRALVRASYSEFFRRGSETLQAAVPYARKLTGYSVGYALLVGVCLWIAAPFLPSILGDDFADSVTALRWLAFVPAIRATQFFPANTLSGTDRQWTRARIMSTTAVFNLVANLFLVPAYGWRGAAITTILSEILFSAGLWIAVNRALRAELLVEQRSDS